MNSNNDKVTQQILAEGAETLTALAAVAGEGRGGPRKTRTLVRWATLGSRGVLLAAYHDGCRWYSSKAALARFLSRMTELEREDAQRKDAPAPRPTPRKVRAQYVPELTHEELAERARLLRKKFREEMM